MMLRWTTSCSKNQELRKKNFEDDVINNKQLDKVKDDTQTKQLE